MIRKLLLISLLGLSLVGCMTPEPPLPPPPVKAKTVCAPHPICVTTANGNIICQPRCVMVYKE